LLKYFVFILLLILTSCTSRYDIQLSEVSFDHDGDVDVISYIAMNPTEYNLTCELDIRLEEAGTITDTFDIEAQETKNLSTRAKLPVGETRVILNTRCKPSS